MTCSECRYHSEVDGTYFCDSKNHKRITVRIDKGDAEKDIDCRWADKQAEKEDAEEGRQWMRVGLEINQGIADGMRNESSIDQDVRDFVKKEYEAAKEEIESMKGEQV